MASKKTTVEGAPLPLPITGFVPAEKGYQLSIRGSKLVAANAKGQVLSSVPKEVREAETADRLLAVIDMLGAHRREIEQTVETWMLRSLPVPHSVLTSVWTDQAYREVLENLVVVPKGGAAGLLRAVDAKKGIGLVDADGETVWTKVDELTIPHPILIGELEGLRELAAELGLTQTIKQLFREVFVKSTGRDDDTEITSFRDGRFEMISHARGAARSLGYRTSGPYVICRVVERGGTYEARFWIGDDAYGDALTEELSWVNGAGDVQRLGDVPPIAFSEGMRMASAMYGKRVIEREGGDDD